MSFLDQFSSKVNQGLNQVTSQTKDFTDQVKIENEIRNLGKSLQTSYEELGKAYYSYSRNSGQATPDFEQMLSQIDGILKEIEDKKANKEEIKGKITCRSCGKTIPADRKFCSYCGASTAPAPVPMRAPQQTTAVNTEKCPRCGAEITPGSKFCVSCGMPIPEKTVEGPGVSELHCLGCGAVVAAGMSFCINCGTKLNAEESASCFETKAAEEFQTNSETKLAEAVIEASVSEEGNANENEQEIKEKDTEKIAFGENAGEKDDDRSDEMMTCESVSVRTAFCTTCGAKLGTGAMFCTSCGTKIE